MSKSEIDDYGTKRWYNENGLLHREDGPAAEYLSGDKAWYINGKLHREDGPAIIYSDGSKLWYFDGLFHREDGPAITYVDGSKYWFYHGTEVKCTSTEEFIRLINLKVFW